MYVGGTLFDTHDDIFSKKAVSLSLTHSFIIFFFFCLRESLVFGHDKISSVENVCW